MQKFVQLLCLAIAFCFTTTLNAQVLLEELFNGSLGSFTSYSVIGDGQEWVASEFGTDEFAQMNGYDDGVQDNEDWLISPAIDMDVYSDEVLTFINGANFDGPDLLVLVSTDYDGSSDPNTATWDDRSADASWSPGDYAFVDSGELDLSGYSGTAYIAFKYISNPNDLGKLWRVDYLKVEATTQTNVIDVEKPALISTPMVHSDQLTFDVLAQQSDMEFAIFSVNGQLVDQFTNTVQTGTVQHPVVGLVGGIYVLQVRTETGFQSFQFVKN